MLATPGVLPSPAVEDRWAFEVKQDGQRAMVYLPGDGTVLVRARSGRDITAAYPELLPLAGTLGRRAAVLDGEIVALDGQDGATSSCFSSGWGSPVPPPGRRAWPRGCPRT